MIVWQGAEWLTAAEIADQIGPDVTAAILRDWKRRGLIRGTVVGAGQHRTAHYRRDDVTEAEHQTRTSPTGRPRPTTPAA